MLSRPQPLSPPAPRPDAVYVFDTYSAGPAGSSALIHSLRPALEDLRKPKLVHAHGRVGRLCLGGSGGMHASCSVCMHACTNVSLQGARPLRSRASAAPTRSIIPLVATPPSPPQELQSLAAEFQVTLRPILDTQASFALLARLAADGPTALATPELPPDARSLTVSLAA